MGIRVAWGLVWVLASPLALAQIGVPESEEEVTLAPPPALDWLQDGSVAKSASDVRAVRDVLVRHRITARRELYEHIRARHGELEALIGEEAMRAYTEFRLKGQAMTPANGVYRHDSQERRIASGEAGGREGSTNLLTGDSVNSLLGAELVPPERAEAFLAKLAEYRAQRQAMYDGWDAQKERSLSSGGLSAVALSAEQLERVIDSDRLAIRFGLMQQRRELGMELLNEAAAQQQQ